MDTDFKLNFIANQSAKTDMNVQSSLKTNESRQFKSFESTLNAKKMESSSEKKDDTARKAAESGNKEKPETKTESRRSQKSRDEKANEAGKERNEKTEAPKSAKSEETAEKENGSVKQQEASRPEAAAEETPIDNEKLPQEISDEVIALVAEALGVTPEQVEQSLNAMDIEPEGLTAIENVNTLIMAVNEMETPSDLLKMPELQELQSEIKGIMETALSKAEAAKMPDAQAATQTIAQTAAQSVPQDVSQAAAENVSEGVGQATEQTVVQTVAKADEKPVAQTQTETSQVEMSNQNSQEINQTAKTESEAPEENIAVQTAEKPQQKAETTETLPEEAEAPQQNTPNINVHKSEERKGTNTGSNSQGNSGQSHESTEIPKAVVQEPAEQAPIIIQKGEETIVEVGGKTISRTQQRPAPQASEVLNQIIDKMKLDFKPGANEIKINLRPDDLGELTVKIATESGRVTAEIITENSKIKELVEENLTTLKESLLKQGVEVGELSVSVGQQDGGEKMQQFMREQSKSRARMSQIINKITGEEIALDTINYANEAEANGSTVNFSA